MLTGRLRARTSRRARSARRAAPPGRALGEPVIRQAVTRGDAHHGRAVRDGPHDRGGARARRASARRAATAIPTTCWAKRRAPRPTPRAISRAYDDAIDAIGAPRRGRGVAEAPGISVKLSALHPRYELAQRERVHARTAAARCSALAPLARERRHRPHHRRRGSRPARAVARPARARWRATPALAGWNGLGLVVQAYQKRAPAGDRLARRPGAAHAAAG